MSHSMHELLLVAKRRNKVLDSPKSLQLMLFSKIQPGEVIKYKEYLRINHHIQLHERSIQLMLGKIQAIKSNLSKTLLHTTFLSILMLEESELL